MVEFSGFGEFAADLRDFADEAREAAREVPSAVDTAVELTVRAMAASASHRAPEDEGDLERSIEAYRRELMSWGFGTDNEAGPPQEYGADPHIIRPDTADALRFEVGGETVFAAKVEHPGNPPQPFVGPAFHEHKSDLEANINAELDRVFDRAFS